MSPRKVKVPCTSHQDPSAASWTEDCGVWARAGGCCPSWLPALSLGPGQAASSCSHWLRLFPEWLRGPVGSVLPHPDPSSSLCVGTWESGDWRAALLKAVFLLKQFVKPPSGGQGPLRPPPPPQPHNPVQSSHCCARRLGLEPSWEDVDCPVSPAGPVSPGGGPVSPGGPMRPGGSCEPRGFL